MDGFDNLPEQDEAKRLLRAALTEGPAHAYLFHGPAGVGKRGAALAFAGELLATRRGSSARSIPTSTLEPVATDPSTTPVAAPATCTCARSRRAARFLLFSAERKRVRRGRTLKTGGSAPVLLSCSSLTSRAPFGDFRSRLPLAVPPASERRAAASTRAPGSRRRLTALARVAAGRMTGPALLDAARWPPADCSRRAQRLHRRGLRSR